MTFIRANHYRDISADEWPWPHFTPEEMACRGTGKLVVSVELMDKLERLRKRLGNRPLIVNSGYRTPEHNRKVGGVDDSQHLDGKAADIILANMDGAEIEGHARQIGFTGIGRYPHKGIIHVDVGPARTWGRAWPKRPTRFSEERQLEPSAKDRAIAIGSTAGSAATGIAGVLGVAQSPAVQIAMIAVLVLLAAGAFVAWRKGWLS